MCLPIEPGRRPRFIVGRSLVQNGMFDVIDNEDVDRTLNRPQLEAEFILDSIDGCSVDVLVARGSTTLDGRPHDVLRGQLNRERACEAGSVDHRRISTKTREVKGQKSQSPS